MWTVLLSLVHVDHGTLTQQDLQLLTTFKKQKFSVTDAARELGLSESVLRRHLSRVQGLILQDLRVPEQLGPLQSALHKVEQVLLLVLPVGLHPLMKHLLALKDRQRRHALKQSKTSASALHPASAQQIDTLQAQSKQLRISLKDQQNQLKQLKAEKQQLQQKILALQRDIKVHETLLPDFLKGAPEDMQKCLLEALKERDEWKTKAERATRRLEDLKEHEERTFRDRDRLALLKHFRRRLMERFGVVLDEVEVFALDETVQDLPVMARTRDGSPVKQITLEGKMVFVVVTPDRCGRPTATTAYTRDMLRH